MPRVVVPTESEERAATQSGRRRRALVIALFLLAMLAAAAIAGLSYYRGLSRKPSADTVFVSAPAWPGQARKQAAKPIESGKEYLLQVGAYTDKRLADTLAAKLEGLPWDVSVVAPLRATDSTNKVIVSGITDRAVAKRVADSLSIALKLRVLVLDPPGARTSP